MKDRLLVFVSLPGSGDGCEDICSRLWLLLEPGGIPLWLFNSDDCFMGPRCGGGEIGLASSRDDLRSGRRFWIEVEVEGIGDEGV